MTNPAFIDKLFLLKEDFREDFFKAYEALDELGVIDIPPITIPCTYCESTKWVEDWMELSDFIKELPDHSALYNEFLKDEKPPVVVEETIPDSNPSETPTIYQELAKKCGLVFIGLNEWSDSEGNLYCLTKFGFSKITPEPTTAEDTPVVDNNPPPLTYRDILNQLREPERSQALNNCKKLDEFCIYHSDGALTHSFNWAETQEGYKYWSDLYSKIANGCYFNKQSDVSVEQSTIGPAIEETIPVVETEPSTPTYRELIEKLREPERSLALEYCSDLNASCDDPSLFISRGFVWGSTNEGTAYWSNIDKQIKEGTYFNEKVI